MRIAIRGFAGGVKKFEDRLDVPEDAGALEQLLPDLCEKHGAALAAHDLHVIEIEFVDEPDPHARYFRIGADSRGMVMPIGIDLTGGNKGNAD